MGFGHINTLAVMDKDDTFDKILLLIEVRLIDIGTDVSTQLRLDF